MLTCGCGRWMHTEGVEERSYGDGKPQWFIRTECRGCGLRVGVDVPAGQPGGFVDRMMWTDDAIHRLDRMPPYMAPLVRGEIEQDMRVRGERVVTYDILHRPRTGAGTLSNRRSASGSHSMRSPVLGRSKMS